MRMVAVVGSNTVSGQEAKAVVLEASRVVRANQAIERERRRPRSQFSPDRPSVARGMARVEQRLVEAFGVLGRSTTNPGPRQQSQHGIGYMLDRDDKWGAAVAGGGWLSQEPPPPPASAHEVDASEEALEWLNILDKQTARVVAAGARSKNGDVRRRVNWIRVRLQLPECASWSASRLRRTYDEGLRVIGAQVGA